MNDFFFRLAIIKRTLGDSLAIWWNQRFCRHEGLREITEWTEEFTYTYERCYDCGKEWHD